jgi:hypothetical protein
MITFGTQLSAATRRASSYRHRLARRAHTILVSHLVAAGLMTCLVSYSATVGNAKLDQIETTIGTAPELHIYNGTMPANADAALSGNTLLASGTLPSDWMAAASAKSKAKAGTWTVTGQSGAGGGTAGTFWRIYVSTTCHLQGTFGATTTINTNGATAANSNVLNFASTTGVAVGQAISGTGVPAGATVLAFTGTTVTMSIASTAGVSSSVAITFGYDMTVDNNSIANTQVLTVNTFSLTEGN